MVTKEGYASIEVMYDNNQNDIAEIFRDGNHKLIEKKDGYAIGNWVHDRNGKVVESYGYGADEKNIGKIKPGPFMTTSGLYTTWTSGDKTRLQIIYYHNGKRRMKSGTSMENLKVSINPGIPPGNLKAK